MSGQTLKEDRIIEENKELLNQDMVMQSLESKGEQSNRARVITGLLGKSERQGYWRIYTTVYLNNYIEVSEGDILSSFSLENPSNPLGGTIVKIKGGATTKSVSTSLKGEREFLEGDIAKTFMPTTTVDVPNVVPMATTPTSAVCATITLCLRSITCKIFT